MRARVGVFLVLLVGAAAAIDAHEFAARVRHPRVGLPPLPGRPRHPARALAELRHRAGAALSRPDDVEAVADFVEFLKGFAYGMDVILGDPAACVKDATGAMAQFNASYVALRDGFKKKNVALIVQGIFALANGIEYVAHGLKDCGLVKLAEDITKIVIAIRSGDIHTLIKHEIIHIIAHQRDLVHLFKGIVSNWQAKNWYGVGDDVGEIVAILLEGANNAVEITPKDAAEFVRGVAEGLGASMPDPTACARDIDGMIASFKAAWDDIRTGIKRISVKIIKRALQEFADGLHLVAAAMTDCGLQKLADEITQIVQLIRDGKALEVIAKEAIHIIRHGREFIGFFRNASDYWKAARYRDSGRETGKIVGFLAEV